MLWGLVLFLRGKVKQPILVVLSLETKPTIGFLSHSGRQATMACLLEQCVFWTQWKEPWAGWSLKSCFFAGVSAARGSGATCRRVVRACVCRLCRLPPECRDTAATRSSASMVRTDISTIFYAVDRASPQQMSHPVVGWTSQSAPSPTQGWSAKDHLPPGFLPGWSNIPLGGNSPTLVSYSLDTPFR